LVEIEDLLTRILDVSDVPLIATAIDINVSPCILNQDIRKLPHLPPLLAIYTRLLSTLLHLTSTTRSELALLHNCKVCINGHHESYSNDNTITILLTNYLSLLGTGAVPNACRAIQADVIKNSTY
jgi:hypothetical protein